MSGTLAAVPSVRHTARAPPSPRPLDAPSALGSLDTPPRHRHAPRRETSSATPTRGRSPKIQQRRQAPPEPWASRSSGSRSEPRRAVQTIRDRRPLFMADESPTDRSGEDWPTSRRDAVHDRKGTPTPRDAHATGRNRHGITVLAPNHLHARHVLPLKQVPEVRRSPHALDLLPRHDPRVRQGTRAHAERQQGLDERRLSRHRGLQAPEPQRRRLENEVQPTSALAGVIERRCAARFVPEVRCRERVRRRTRQCHPVAAQAVGLDFHDWPARVVQDDDAGAGERFPLPVRRAGPLHLTHRPASSACIREPTTSKPAAVTVGRHSR